MTEKKYLRVDLEISVNTERTALCPYQITLWFKGKGIANRVLNLLYKVNNAKELEAKLNPKK